jgi:protein-tyrosine phosphatase
VDIAHAVAGWTKANNPTERLLQPPIGQVGNFRQMKTILFLCTGNYFRSRFAEELFNHRVAHAPIGWQAQSRALAIERLIGVSDQMSPFAVKGLAERGFTAKTAERLPQQCVHADFETVHHTVALNEPEHRPLMLERFPNWAARIEYWQVWDADVVPPSVALAAIDQQIEALLSRFGGDSR